jgi:hypothetical protein
VATNKVPREPLIIVLSSLMRIETNGKDLKRAPWGERVHPLKTSGWARTNAIF